MSFPPTAWPPVPVLLYHHIAPHAGDTVTVTPEVFAAQMAYLAAAGFQTLTLDELCAYAAGELPLTGRAVVITFDDGWLDFYRYAWPVLRQYRLKASCFLITGRSAQAAAEPAGEMLPTPTHAEAKGLVAAGRAREVVLTWELARELALSGLVEFHSHLVSHRHSTRLTDTELQGELSASRALLTAELGCSGRHLCWPYGDWDERCRRLAVAAGYTALYTTTPGAVRPGCDPLAIPRVEMRDRPPAALPA